MNKLFFLLFAGVLVFAGCQKKQYSNYRLIDGDTPIADLPFSNNEDFVLGEKKKIEYKIVNDSIYTSVYFSAHVGCPSAKIVSSIENENERLILSVEITRSMFSSGCPVNNIQLNYKVKNNNYKEVYFVIKSIYHPF